MTRVQKFLGFINVARFRVVLYPQNLHPAVLSYSAFNRLNHSGSDSQSASLNRLLPPQAPSDALYFFPRTHSAYLEQIRKQSQELRKK